MWDSMRRRAAWGEGGAAKAEQQVQRIQNRWASIGRRLGIDTTPDSAREIQEEERAKEPSLSS